MGLGDFLAGAGKAVYRAGARFGNDFNDTLLGAGKDVVASAKTDVSAIGAASNAIFGEQGVVGKTLVTPSKAPQIVGHAVGTGATVAKDTGVGLYRAGDYVAHHPLETYEAANQVGWKILKDQITNPVNIAALALTAGSSAAVAGIEGLTEGASAIKSGSSVMEGVQQGLTAVREGRSFGAAAEGAEAAAEGANLAPKKFLSGRTSWTGSSQAAADREMFGSFGLGPATGVAEEGGGSSLLSRYGNARSEAFGNAREALTGRRVSRLAEGRSIIGDQVASRGGAFNESLGQLIGTSPGAPEYGGRFAELRYSASSGQSLNQDAQSLRTGLHVAADPKAAAMDLGKKELIAHEDDIVNAGEKVLKNKVVSTLKDKLLGDDSEKKTSKRDTGFQTPQPQLTAGMQLQPSDGGFVASTSQRQFGSQPLTTVQQSAPDHIGPSHWYDSNNEGSQSNYATGRGFRSPASQDAWGAAAS